MTDKRSGKDRRKKTDRRCGCTTSYNGPEKRGIRYRRLDISRREGE